MFYRVLNKDRKHFFGMEGVHRNRREVVGEVDDDTHVVVIDRLAFVRKRPCYYFADRYFFFVDLKCLRINARHEKNISRQLEEFLVLLTHLPHDSYGTL